MPHCRAIVGLDSFFFLASLGEKSPPCWPLQIFFLNFWLLQEQDNEARGSIPTTYAGACYMHIWDVYKNYMWFLSPWESRKPMLGFYDLFILEQNNNTHSALDPPLRRGGTVAFSPPLQAPRKPLWSFCGHGGLMDWPCSLKSLHIIFFTDLIGRHVCLFFQPWFCRRWSIRHFHLLTTSHSGTEASWINGTMKWSRNFNASISWDQNCFLLGKGRNKDGL